MEESRNQVVMQLKNKIAELKKIQSLIIAQLEAHEKEKITILKEYEENKDSSKDSEIMEKLEDVKVLINSKEFLLRKNKQEINYFEEQIVRVISSPLDKVKDIAKENFEKIKPVIEDFSEKAKEKYSSTKEDISDIFNKEFIGEKVQDLKENKHIKETVEKAKIVKEEMGELNLYKIIGQLKKNANETFEDLESYIKSNEVDKKFKNKVDKIVSPEVKGKLSSFFTKLKNGIDDAVEIIAETNEDEDSAKIKENLRKFKGVKENYLKSWIRERKVKVDNGLRNKISDIHNNYVLFMKEEYGQEENSKLIVYDYHEFIKIAAKFLTLPIVFNEETGEVNLKIS